MRLNTQLKALNATMRQRVRRDVMSTGIAVAALAAELERAVHLGVGRSTLRCTGALRPDDGADQPSSKSE
ncbi:hypothetical protein [Salinispora sp. H7-4]|uniref:hypothetical protein n=1 Tax=Salinispora sp. H7-4 TaxID=2748321 RepID=UPI0015D3D624|nr:hypothetical protein [Salinispora sp. H7-4]NYT96149.1 hypothetical protein [Salinispora sp. H7-4]